MNTMKRIGQTLKLLRVAADLKQTELAKDLGVTANYLSLVENGRREPSLTFLQKFANRLDVPLKHFLWLALEEEGASPEEEEIRNSMNQLLAELVRRQNNGHTKTPASRS